MGELMTFAKKLKEDMKKYEDLFHQLTNKEDSLKLQLEQIKKDRIGVAHRVEELKRLIGQIDQGVESIKEKAKDLDKPKKKEKE